MTVAKSSPIEKLMVLIERSVRKVVREELEYLTESKNRSVLSNTPQALTAPQPRPVQQAKNNRRAEIVDKISQNNPLLKEIFAGTTPFGMEDTDDLLPEMDPMFDDMPQWTSRAPLTEESHAPVEVVKVPSGIDPAVSRIADIMNKTDYKSIVERSKEFDRM